MGEADRVGYHVWLSVAKCPGIQVDFSDLWKCPYAMFRGKTIDINLLTIDVSGVN